MASWENLKAYIASNYKIAEDGGDHLWLDWTVEDGRYQRVGVFLAGELAGEQWAAVQTNVAKSTQVDPWDVLQRSSGFIAGALVATGKGEGNTVYFKHSFPLGNLDPNEFETPLHVAVHFGDMLEKELTGGDNF